MEIREAIVHGFEKEAQSNDVEFHPRDTNSSVDAMMQHLGQEVLKVYGRRSDTNGTFDADETTYPFASLLRNYHHQQQSLVDFSVAACNLIAAQMRQSYLATGGYAFFIRYANQGNDWLLVLMLKLKPGTSINEETLELLPNLSFDISHLHEAARINLDKWSSGDQPYLSFIKKISGKDDVSKYFRLALGCTEYTDSRFNTQQIVDALNRYCEENGVEGDDRLEARKQLHDYFEEKHNSDDKSVNLVALSARINDSEPEAFRNFVKDNEIPISDVFTPSKTIYGKLRRIKRKFGNVSVSFSAEDVEHDLIDYDTEGTLYIRNIPESLMQDIRRARGDE
ncbi:MAG: hypothetical protein CME72_12820 [Halomonadaceae bacterium]|nr:hypothetical protein [Halomonadaceae bacterium]